MAGSEPTTRYVAPVRLDLLITIVDMKRTAYYTSLIQSFDANLQISVAAQGTADAAILEYLGLTDSAKVCIFSIIREDRADDIIEELKEKFKTVKDGNGIAVTIPLTSMIGRLVFGFLSNDHSMVRKN